jgi:hypothetical protein
MARRGKIRAVSPFLEVLEKPEFLPEKTPDFGPVASSGHDILCHPPVAVHWNRHGTRPIMRTFMPVA